MRAAREDPTTPTHAQGRAWARNPNANEAVASWNELNAHRGHITVPGVASGMTLGTQLLTGAKVRWVPKASAAKPAPCSSQVLMSFNRLLES